MRSTNFQTSRPFLYFFLLFHSALFDASPLLSAAPDACLGGSASWLWYCKPHLSFLSVYFFLLEVPFLPWNSHLLFCAAWILSLGVTVLHAYWLSNRRADWVSESSAIVAAAFLSAKEGRLFRSSEVVRVELEINKWRLQRILMLYLKTISEWLKLLTESFCIVYVDGHAAVSVDVRLHHKRPIGYTVLRCLIWIRSE